MICSLVFRVFAVLLVMGDLYSETLFTYPIAKSDSEFENPNLSHPNNLSQWNFFADMLYFKVDGIATWALELNFMPFTTSSGKPAVNFTQTTKSVTFDWDLGLRLGLGYQFEDDRWVTSFYYTRFETEAKDVAHVSSPNSNITSALLGQWLTFGFSSTEGWINWHILLNAIDWELGRNCSASKGLSFRPYLGIKGSSINQIVHSKWIAMEHKSTENLKNNFLGAGPKGGVNTNWHLGSVKNHSFSLFSDVSMGMLAGYWTLKDIQKTSMNSSVIGINPSNWGATMTVQGLTGFSWDIAFKNNQSNIGFSVGYEFQYWYDQLKIFTFLEGTLHAALVLQGGMINIHVNY